MPNLPERASIQSDNAPPTDGSVLLVVIIYHGRNAFEIKYVLLWAVIRRPPKERTYSGGINVIKSFKPPKI